MPNDSQNLVSRIGSWFKRTPRPLNGDMLDSDHPLRPELQLRGSVLRPWAKRDQAISNLQDGFHTLTDLMTAIRENLTEQNRRQDELLRHLSHLPEAIQSIPESNRVQGEALRAIHARMEHQNEQQQMIAEILHKVSEAGAEQSKTVDVVRDRVEVMAEHERKIADNLSSVGTAMQTVSRNSQASAQVLEQMRDNISSRDGQLERILHKQAMRFTSMLAIAIFLSIAALIAVAVVGYELLNKTSPAPQINVPASVQQPHAVRSHIFGYDSWRLTLSEVTFHFSAQDLRTVANFLLARSHKNKKGAVELSASTAPREGGSCRHDFQSTASGFTLKS